MQGMQACSPQWTALDRDRHLLLRQEAWKSGQIPGIHRTPGQCFVASLQGWCDPRKLLRMGVKLRPGDEGDRCHTESMHSPTERWCGTWEVLLSVRSNRWY